MPALWEDLPLDLKEVHLMSAIENEVIVIADAQVNPHLFLRGRVQLPAAADGGGLFEWNLWVEGAEKDFEAIVKRWFDPARRSAAPFPGVLACRIGGYPDTIGVGVLVHEQDVGTRPIFTVVDEHLLQREQAKGIDLHRHSELVRLSQRR
jgi:hypothetical protein